MIRGQKSIVGLRLAKIGNDIALSFINQNAFSHTGYDPINKRRLNVSFFLHYRLLFQLDFYAILQTVSPQIPNIITFDSTKEVREC